MHNEALCLLDVKSSAIWVLPSSNQFSFFFFPFMIEPKTQIRAVGFYSREGQEYISGASAFPFYCSLLLKDSEGAKVHLLILLPAKHRHCSMLGSFQFSHSNCLTLCDPMDCSTPGFLVHRELLELAQTHVHRVGDVV